MTQMPDTLHYFMAHAPAKPQEWFKPIMTTKRPEFPPFPGDEEFERALSFYMKYKHLTEPYWPEGVTTLNKWSGEEFPLTNELKHRVELFVKTNAETRNRQIEWDAEHTKQFYVQWPRAWANEQIKLARDY